MTTTPAPAAAPSALPPLGKARTMRAPTSAERMLDSGLRVLAVRRPGVPLVELRLRLPLASRTAATRGRASLLAHSLLLGTEDRDELGLVRALQELGSELVASSDADRLMIGGGALAERLPDLLQLLAEVLTGATYPAGPVSGERDRLAEQLTIARAQPDVVAGLARARQIFGRHPYGVGMPAGSDVSGLRPAEVRRMHRERVQPDGGTLVLVGDLSPARTLDTVATALQGWTTGSRPAPLAPVAPTVGEGILLVDRPGSVQSLLRLTGAAPRRQDPGYAALQLANMIFGGYFSSRYVNNIREDKGYTYTPRSGYEQRQSTALLTVDADVSTNVTGAALLETRYELGRMATTPVGQDELDDTRQYVLGTLSLQTSTQAGLASTLVALAGLGLDLDWIAQHRKALLAVTVADVLAASRRYLAPSAFATLVVGDAGAVRDELGAFGTVTDAPVA